MYVVACDVCNKWRHVQISVFVEAQRNDFKCGDCSKLCECNPEKCLCQKKQHLEDSIYLVTRMLRYRHADLVGRDAVLNPLVKAALQHRANQYKSKRDFIYYCSVYGGFLGPTHDVLATADKVVQQCCRGRPSIIKLLKLTHACQYGMWWGHEDVGGRCVVMCRFIQQYMNSLKLKFHSPTSKLSTKKMTESDLYLQCLMSLNIYPVELLQALLMTTVVLRPAFSPPVSEQAEHLLMLCVHFIDCINLCGPGIRLPANTRHDTILLKHLIETEVKSVFTPNKQEYLFDDFTPKCSALLSQFIATCLNHLQIKNCEILPHMSFVRVKSHRGSFTKVHADFGAVVDKHKAVQIEDSHRIVTIWVSLGDYDPDQSVLFFPPNPPTCIGIGQMFVFDLSVYHQATLRTCRGKPPRVSIDFRVKLN